MQSFLKTCSAKSGKILKHALGGKMENMEKDYLMSSIDEYFNLLDAENQKRSQMVAKSLTKYLKNSQENSKFDELKSAQG